MTDVIDNDYDQTARELLDLYTGLLMPFMSVTRDDMPFPKGNGRPETDSEHVFSLGIIAITVAERLGLELDRGLIAIYALVHDLVEAYAGDISVRSPEAYAVKHIKEAEALAQISERYKTSAPWIASYIEKYEEREDEESRFVYAIDKCMGAITRLADGGKHFAKYYPEPDGSQLDAVTERLRKKASAHPEGLKLFEAIYSELKRQAPKFLEQAKK